MGVPKEAYLTFREQREKKVQEKSTGVRYVAALPRIESETGEIDNKGVRGTQRDS